MINRNLDYIIEQHYASGKNVLNNEEYHIQQALVLCNDNLRVEGKITYAPIYMLMFLHCKQRPKQVLFHLELPEFMK